MKLLVIIVIAVGLISAIFWCRGTVTDTGPEPMPVTSDAHPGVPVPDVVPVL